MDVHRIDVMVDVIAKDRAAAESCLDETLHHAFIYGCGQRTYGQDHSYECERVYDYEIFDPEDESVLLAYFNGWLDSMRFDGRLTEQEQNICWEMLNIIKGLQEKGAEE